MGLLETIEAEVAQHIAADPFFDAIDVHVDAQKNIVSEVTIKIAKLKRLVVPYVARADMLSVNLPKPMFDRIDVQVGCFVNPKLAGAGATAREMAERVHSILHQFKPDSLLSSIVAATPSIETVADDLLNIVNANFVAKGDLEYTLPKLAAVGHSEALGECTLTHETAGAALYYTVNTGVPTPRSGTLYTAPFAVSAGQKIRARAWLAGYLSSDLLTFTVA